jgi:hypothetical protein
MLMEDAEEGYPLSIDLEAQTVFMVSRFIFLVNLL